MGCHEPSGVSVGFGVSTTSAAQSRSDPSDTEPGDQFVYVGSAPLAQTQVPSSSMSLSPIHLSADPPLAPTVGCASAVDRSQSFSPADPTSTNDHSPVHTLAASLRSSALGQNAYVVEPYSAIDPS